MLIFDIETNGLLDTTTQIHCMSILDTNNLEVQAYRPWEIKEGIQRLMNEINNNGTICGHNIISFDIPAIEKLYPEEFHIEKHTHVIDTLVMARLLNSNIQEQDLIRYRKKELAGNLIGSHSLKAYGHRLGILKGTYAEDNEEAWEVYNEDMLEYNKQDVRVTYALYKSFQDRIKGMEQAILLEHKAQWLMTKMEENGFPFDIPDALKLVKTLRQRAEEIDTQISAVVPKIPDKIFTPKRDNKKLGYKKGVPIQRYKPFNPNSRQQIEWIFRTHYNYTPDKADLYTEEGRLKIDESTFEFIEKDEKAPQGAKKIAPLFEERLMLCKRLGQLADGKQAWLKHVKSDGKIHGRVNPNGTVTGRATHSNPNVAQVPHVGTPYGEECRKLFNVPQGWTQAGIDACGLELRCLAHYLSPYDKGKYAHEVVHGDIHTSNQKAAGLATRNLAKTFIYAFLYGAGDLMIGELVGGKEKEGKAIKKKFFKATPSIKLLKEDIEKALIKTRTYNRKIQWKRKYLKGLDGRKLYVRSIHSALNLLLQSAGALICKYWIVRTEERLTQLGYKHGWNGDFVLMAWVHDEGQYACRTEEIADVVIHEAQEAMRDTQKHFKFRVQLDTEGKKGKNWYDCH